MTLIYDICIEKNEDHSLQTRKAFRQLDVMKPLDDPEIEALPDHWTKPVGFDEGLAYLDRVITGCPYEFNSRDLRARLVDGRLVELSCDTPLKLRHPVVSASLRLVER